MLTAVRAHIMVCVDGAQPKQVPLPVPVTSVLYGFDDLEDVSTSVLHGFYWLKVRACVHALRPRLAPTPCISHTGYKSHWWYYGVSLLVVLCLHFTGLLQGVEEV